MTPLRVLAVSNMYPPQHLGGYELVLQGAVRALRAAGHSVEVLTTDVRFRDAAEEDEGVHRDLRWWWRDHAFPRLSLRERLAVERHDARVLRSFDADVVTWWAMGGMPLSLLGVPAAPSVAFVHDGWPIYGPPLDARPWFSPGRGGMDAVGQWVFVSEFAWRRVREHGAIPRGARHSVATSGIDPSYLLDPPPAHDWGWRLLVVGRIDEDKGIDTALEALARTPAQATLTVVGEGNSMHGAALRERAAALGVADRVDWAGARSREDLKRVYAAHDAVLFPVRWDEPWGLVPLEAMARGVPVLATGRGGSAEYLRDGVNALLAPADDVRAFFAALERLARDPALRAQLREGGLATAREHTDERFHEAVLAAVQAAATGVTSERVPRR